MDKQTRVMFDAKLHAVAYLLYVGAHIASTMALHGILDMVTEMERLP